MGVAGNPDMAQQPVANTPSLPPYAEFLHDLVNDQRVERFAALGMDAAGRPVYVGLVEGNAHSVPNVLSAIRQVIGCAHVQAMVICHNHPSATSAPSLQDRRATERIAALGRLAEAQLVDHLIFGTDGVYSLSADQLCGHMGRDSVKRAAAIRQIESDLPSRLYRSSAAKVAEFVLGALVVVSGLLPLFNVTALLL